MPSPIGAASSASVSEALEATAAARTSFAKSMNFWFLATKSVSELTSTMTPTVPSVVAASRPARAWRPSRLDRDFRPLRRMISRAFSASPSASVSAFLTSIMPAPVCSRSAFTSAAVKFAIG